MTDVVGGVSPLGQAEPRDRRELIVSRAAEMFARKGTKSTTVREIATAVGVLSGSLYHYFDSKDTIVEEILMGFLDAIRTRYAAVLAGSNDPAESLRGVVLASLEVAGELPAATTIYQNEFRYLRHSPRFREVQAAATDVQGIFLGIIEQGVADGSFRDDIPPRAFHRLIRDAVWLSGRWHRTDSDRSMEHLADDITSVFLHGFAARRTPTDSGWPPRSDAE